jgi:hypothetical protein
MKKPPVIHPFLLAAFPVLFLFVNNIDTVSASQILLPSALMLGFASLSTWLLRILLGDGRKAGIVVSIFLVLFSSYGHLSLAITVLARDRLGLDLGHAHLLLAWAALLTLSGYMAMKAPDPDKWTAILNVMGVALIAPSLAGVGVHELRARRIERSVTVEAADGTSANPLEEGGEGAPDVYYIIVDRYASTATLQEQFHFDNSEFTDYLTSKGFYVATESRANYPKTFQSLASSLNMKHLTYLTAELGADASDQTVVYAMLQDYQVWRFLRSRGYRFFHVGSSWEPTRVNPYADVGFTPQPPEFLMMLYRTTMLDPIGVRLGVPDRRETRRRTVLRQLDRLAEVPDCEGPKFVFAHILLPHEPYVFGTQGETLTQEQVEARTGIENYLGQLAFTNSMIKRLVDQILSQSDRPPIIVLQADEGPCTCLEEFGGSCGDGIDWRQLSDEALRAHMRILNAYYLPGIDYETVLYPCVTPVNSFRIIFDHYFGTDYGLLEDESYIFEDTSHPYTFIGVTDRVAYD